MPGIFQLIGDAWNFGRKQPALIHVSFWLLLLPMLAMSLLSRLIAMQRFSNAATSGPATAASLLMIVLAVVFVWGMACVLIIGKRMLAAKAGRSRTSFKAVRREARGFIIPLILTSILRSVFAFLWALLLIIPGIIYSVRTAFYFIIIVEEGVSYRAALQRSKEIARGHVWDIFWRFVVLAIILFAPISIVTAILHAFSDTYAAQFGTDLLSTIFTTLSAVLFILCIVQMYGSLRPATAPVTGSVARSAKKRK
ncbi:MAG TPA: hypothetical protein VHA78_00520 [Candidatus Peribacteraceae bacterium]|nr:hypothetical protein [Candidatus Peribacteraceae bacterium]